MDDESYPVTNMQIDSANKKGLFAATVTLLPQVTDQLTSGADGLSGMLNAAFQTSLAVGAVLAMFRIAYAGWLYMGSDIWSNKKKAIEIFQNAIIGLLLLLGVYLILYQIDRRILLLRIMAPTEQGRR